MMTTCWTASDGRLGGCSSFWVAAAAGAAPVAGKARTLRNKAAFKNLNIVPPAISGFHRSIDIFA
jgi:hypothetical protein